MWNQIHYTMWLLKLVTQLLLISIKNPLQQFWLKVSWILRLLAEWSKIVFGLSNNARQIDVIIKKTANSCRPASFLTIVIDAECDTIYLTEMRNQFNLQNNCKM